MPETPPHTLAYRIGHAIGRSRRTHPRAWYLARLFAFVLIVAAMQVALYLAAHALVQEINAWKP